MINNILLDSCVWIGLCDANDSLHQKAFSLVEGLDSDRLFLCDHVFAEVMTRLRKKTGKEGCFVFLRFLKNFGMTINVSDRDILLKCTSIFLNKDEDLSFTDCLLLAEAKANKMKIFTFDRVLEKALGELT